MGRRKYKDIEVRGVVYPTVQDAARALGVTPESVCAAIRKGTLHRVGTRRTGIEPMQVEIAGTTYPSAAAAAEAIGCTRSAVYQAIDAGDPDRLVRRPIYKAALRSRPVTLGGISWPSRAAASRDLGFADEYVARAMKSQSRRRLERVLAAAMRFASQQHRVSRG